MIEIYNFKPMIFECDPAFCRADLEIYGIDHFRPSFTGLVFFNVGKLNPKKVSADHPACVGRFSVFGHDQCVGDEGHCQVSAPQRFDVRRSHPLTPAFKRVVVTDGLRAALEQGNKIAISIAVADELGSNKPKRKKGDPKPKRPLFKCRGLQLVSFV